MHIFFIKVYIELVPIEVKWMGETALNISLYFIVSLAKVIQHLLKNIEF